MLITPEDSYIEVEISDLVENGAILAKRKERFLTMRIADESEMAELIIHVNVRVDHYVRLDDGSYGPAYHPSVYPYKYETLVADYESAFNLDTGEIVMKPKGMEQKAWEADLDAAVEPYMLQSRYFKTLLRNNMVEIDDLLRDFMLRADKPPFNRFSYDAHTQRLLDGLV